MNCNHGNEAINGQTVHVERAHGAKEHPYVICAVCGKRIWVHVKGLALTPDGERLMVEVCDNPPILWNDWKKLGLPASPFIPKEINPTPAHHN